MRLRSANGFKKYGLKAAPSRAAVQQALTKTEKISESSGFRRFFVANLLILKMENIVNSLLLATTYCGWIKN